MNIIGMSNLNGMKLKTTGLLYPSDELLKILLERPGLPILVEAQETANSGDFPVMACSYINIKMGEFLDCQQTIESEKYYTDREVFADDIEYALDSDEDLSEEELKAKVDKELAFYEPYWKDCIIITVGNG